MLHGTIALQRLRVLMVMHWAMERQVRPMAMAWAMAHGEMAMDDVARGEMAKDDVAHGEMAMDEVTRGEMAMGAASQLGPVPLERARPIYPWGSAVVREMAMDDVAHGEMAMDEVTHGDMAMNEVTHGEMAMDEVTRGEMAIDEVTHGEMAMDVTMHVGMSEEMGRGLVSDADDSASADRFVVLHGSSSRARRG